MKSKSKPPASRKTLGPITDLERHLPPDWWKRLFNAIYLKTDADVVESESNSIKEVEKVVEAAHLKEDDRILDLCCGQGRHALSLAQIGFKSVVGLDRSRYLIRLARRRARKSGLPVAFHEGDARKLRFKPGSFDCVMVLGNSFGYFEHETEDVAVLKAIKRVLRPGGRLVMEITDGDWMMTNFEPRSWEWIDGDHLVCRERSLAADGRRIVSREVVIHAEQGVIADQFYAERLYNAEQIGRLLEDSGFEDIAAGPELHAVSERNQDLGMMARRFLISARMPEPADPAVHVHPGARKVTVMMGDGSMPDLVKRGGQFNPEDFETIEILKEALSKLDDFEFSYYDDHESFILEMKSDPPELVLNLCDEGYRNDAYKELHVPAYFEMLGIPYTGAGPSCLGLCYDKSLVRAYAMAYDVPVPMETYVDPADLAATIPAALPALVKPNTGDSSIGITKDAVVHDSQQLIAYLESLRAEWPGRAALIQEYLTGGEYSIGIIGNPGIGFTYLPPLEVDYSGLDPSLPKILGYESKWVPDSPYWNAVSYKEADLPEEQVRRLYDYSALLFERLQCRDYARFDFRADSSGVIKLLEVNPNPGWCWDGKLNLMAGFAGMSYSDLLQAILVAAVDRFELAQNVR